MSFWHSQVSLLFIRIIRIFVAVNMGRLLGIIILAVASLSVSAAEKADSCGSCRDAGSTYWIRQLVDNCFRINDTLVCYPRFPRFCLNVYNWGDRTFNSFDKDYVVGTGKNWKLQAKSYSWLETSTMMFPKRSQISMHSDLYSDAGFSLSFMAVSVGYMWNINSIFSDPTKRRTFNFDFTCSRFAINYQSMSSEGGMKITRFGEYNDGRHINYKFNDISIDSKTLDAYYFFNHRQYSQGAVYSYSKHQLRSAGTALVGINFTEQRITMDFSGLPQEMLGDNPLNELYYRSHYRSYSVMGGYAYNWVLKPRRWTINATGMAAVGYKHLIDRAEEVQTRDAVANMFRVNLAAIYNHRAFFASCTLRSYGFLNYSNEIAHFNTFVSATVTAGIRF